MGVSTYRTKDGRRYRATLYQDGVAVAAKRGFATKAAARQWMSDTAKQKQAPLPIPPTGTAFSLVVGQYLDDMEARRQPNTYAYKKATINRFLIHMGGDFLLGDLTISDIDTYMLNRRQEDGPKAANRDAIELKACLNWAIRKNLWQSNPFREVEPFPEQKFQ